MHTNYTYRPLLRSKSGEAAALQNLAASAKARILPIINMVEKPPASFAADLGAAWSLLPLSLDGTFNVQKSSTTNHFQNLYQQLGDAGISVIPSVAFGASGPYLAAVAASVNKFAPGLVVKAKLQDLPTVDSWALAQGWNLTQIDLVINLEDVSSFDPGLFHPYMAKTLQDHVPAGRWRTVTLAASSAPKDNGGLPQGRSSIPRRCWAAWQASAIKLPFRLDFGDYGTSTPELQDPPGLAMTKATVSVRYTTDKELIIRKGKPTKGKTGEAMDKQYRAHAKALVAEPNFGGLSSCWGDGRIRQIGMGASRSGNRTTWASIAVSRHMSLVSSRLP
jgi:hypothetical protein